MNDQLLEELLAQGENERVELMTVPGGPNAARFVQDRVSAAVCAFLNSGGGRVLIGANEQGEKRGVRDAAFFQKRLEEQLPQFLSPPAMWSVIPIQADEKDFLVVEVPEGMDKPYVSDGSIYTRHGPRNVPADRNEIDRLLKKSSAASERWERRPALRVDYEDLDDKLIRETLLMAHQAARWQGSTDDPLEFLHELGLMAYGNVTNAAVVLYGKHPARVLPQARVRLLVAVGGKVDREYALDQLFDGNLLRTVEEVASALGPYTSGVSSSFSPADWQRRDRVRFPARGALREGIMNALVHRDYESHGAVTILLRPESLQITNPGGLPPGLTPAALKRDHLSVPRNPDIAHICYLHRLIEKVGRGTLRIVEDCRQAHLRDPIWSTSALETSLIFRVRAKSPRDLNKRQLHLLTLLQSHVELTTPHLLELLEHAVTERTVRNDLSLLVERGLVEASGRARSTVYRSLSGGER